MMKIVVLLFLIFNISDLAAQDSSDYQPFQENDSLFLDYLLHNSLQKYPYLLLNIKALDFSGRAAIRTNDLLNYYYKAKKLNRPAFDSLIAATVLSDDTLIVDERLRWDDSVILQRGFIKVLPDPEIDHYVAQGKEDFLDHFFNYEDSLKRWGTLKEIVLCDCKNGKNTYDASCRLRKEAAIASQLFKWRIAAKPDFRLLFIAVDNRPEFVKKSSTSKTSN